MTAYKKNLLSWACLMGVALLSILGGLYISTWFIGLLVAVILTGRFVLNKVTCPNCGTPVTYEGEAVINRIRPPLAFLRRKCAKCGWELDEFV